MIEGKHLTLNIIEIYFEKKIIFRSNNDDIYESFSVEESSHLLFLFHFESKKKMFYE